MRACPQSQRTYPDDTDFCPRDGAHLTAQATETEAQVAAGLSRVFRIVRRLGLSLTSAACMLGNIRRAGDLQYKSALRLLWGIATHTRR
jgi:hypothetical protein